MITASSSRKRERAERTKAEDFDAEEGELIKEENEQEEEVFDQVSCLNLKIAIFISEVHFTSHSVSRPCLFMDCIIDSGW